MAGADGSAIRGQEVPQPAINQPFSEMANFPAGQP